MPLRGPTPVPGLESLGSTPGLDVREAPREGSRAGEAALVYPGGRQSVWVDLSSPAEPAVARSWQVPSYLRLTVPPTWDACSRRFACVVNGRSLLLWDGQETRLDKLTSSAVELRKDVADLVAQHGGAPLLVAFRDGSVRALNQVEKNPDGSDGEVAEPNTSRQVGRVSWMLQKNGQPCLVQDANSRGQRVFCVLSVSADEGLDGGPVVSHLREFFCSKGETLVEMVPTAAGPAALVVASGGDLVLREVLGGEERKFEGLSGLQGKRLLATALKDNYVALAIPAKSGRFTLNVLSLKFLSVVCSLEVEGKSPFSIAALDTYVFMASEDGLVVVQAVDLPRKLDGMVGLLSSGKSSPSFPVTSTVKLYQTLPKMLERGDVNGVEKLLHSARIEDIPELLLLATLEFLLRCPEDSFGKDASSAQVRREGLVLSCLDAPVTEPLMMQYLAALDSGVTVDLLAFLDLAMRVAAREEPADVDRLGNLLTWVGLVLNSHYGSIVVAKDARVTEIVASLSETVSACADRSSFDLGQLLPLVTLVKSGKNVAANNTKSNRDYCIEIVNF